MTVAEALFNLGLKWAGPIYSTSVSVYMYVGQKNNNNAKLV